MIIGAFVIAVVFVVWLVVRRRRQRLDAYASDGARWLHARAPRREATWFNFGDWTQPLDSFEAQCQAFVDALLAAPLADSERTPLRVLDVGCGASGAQSNYVVQRIGSRLDSMVGLDPALSGAARVEHEAVELLACTFEALPESHTRFNVVLAADSLYHIDLPRAVIYAALAERFDSAAPRCWLGVTDLVALAPAGGGWWRRVALGVLARLFRAPNLAEPIALAEYAALLEREQFVNVRVSIVTDVVLVPFVAHLDAQLALMDGILSPLVALKFRAFAALLRFALRHSLFEYVRVTAQRKI